MNRCRRYFRDTAAVNGALAVWGPWKTTPPVPGCVSKGMQAGTVL